MARKTFKESMGKSTKDNAALAFITAAQDEPTEERKSKRLNLLIKPSLFADVEKLAHMQRTSVNGLINDLLAAYAADHRDTIDEYNRICTEGK